MTVKQNVWHCCQDICDRIDEAPGPHGYLSAHVTPRPGKRVQNIYFNFLYKTHEKFCANAIQHLHMRFSIFNMFFLFFRIDRIPVFLQHKLSTSVPQFWSQ